MVLRDGYADASRILLGPFDPSQNFRSERYRNTGSPTPPGNLPIPIKIVVGIIIERTVSEPPTPLGIFSDGFESGDFSAWTSITFSGEGAIVPESANPHHGTYNAKASVHLAGDWALVYKNLAASTHSDLHFRSYYKFGAIFTAGIMNVHGFLSQGDALYESDCDVLFDPPTNKWGISYCDSSGVWHEEYESGTSVVTAGTYHCIELRYKKHASAGIIQLWIDGILKVDLSGLATAYGSIYIGRVHDGVVYVVNTEPTTRNIYIDCVVVADGYIGEDTIPISDSTATSTVRIKSVDEPALSISDSPAINLTRAVSLSEVAISVGDSLSTILTRIKELSEVAVSVADGVTAEKAGAIQVNIDEPGISVSDAIEKAIRRDVPLSEPPISVSDETARAITSNRSIPELSISISDVVSYNLQRSISLSEPAISVSDVVSLIFRRSIDVSEPAISVADALTLAMIRIKEFSEPAINVSDVISHILHRVVSIDEPSISLADDTSLNLERAVDISEPAISIDDAVSFGLFKIVDISEPAISVSDVVLYLLQRDMAILETLGFVGDSVIISTPFVSRFVFEDLGFITDAPSAVNLKERALTEALGLLGETLVVEATHVGGGTPPKVLSTEGAILENQLHPGEANLPSEGAILEKKLNP